MSTKQEHLSRKYADVKGDFIKMFTVDSMRIGAIYEALSIKYYLDKGTIYRIVAGQTKNQKLNTGGKDIP